MVSEQVDSQSARKLYAANACARAILDQFASRQQDRAEVTVDRLLQLLAAEGHEISRRDIIGTLRKLQEIGAGAFVVGRKGQQSRFVRAVNLADLGKLARGGGETSAPRTAIASPATAAAKDVVAHRYVLRPDFTVTVQLPTDLSSAEATRLAEFIKTLPF
jgi:hypothetical protein